MERIPKSAKRFSVKMRVNKDRVHPEQFKTGPGFHVLGTNSQIEPNRSTIFGSFLRRQPERPARTL
ncbi:hypothetical protein CES85_0367 [Ochrobactrum quorumnocens]|uniref:Uncharacterized protein n=1 Tax=Ochrobactrum quorumnocens TaxID=271865 RepID=A0A248UGG4_9HYPH|nr:hypothetical protein CES85_0367 [[Ochrobactrum] quorumnocens]